MNIEQPGRGVADCPHLPPLFQFEIKPAKIKVHGGLEHQTEVKLVDTNSLGRSEEESMGVVEGPAGGGDESREVIRVGENRNSRGEQAMDTPSGEWG